MAQIPTSFSALRHGLRWFSTTAAANSKLYELRIYRIKQINTKKVLTDGPKLMEVRAKHSPLLGYFFSEVGALNEAIHIWEYDGYGQRAQVRKNVAADPLWPVVSDPVISQFESQHNFSMRLFPWSTIPEKITPGGVYFMYTFLFPAGVSHDKMSSSLKTLVEKADLTCLGCWREEIGPNALRNVVAVFHSTEYDSEKNPAFANQEAWAELSKEVTNISSRLLGPAPWSPWK